MSTGQLTASGAALGVAGIVLGQAGIIVAVVGLVLAAALVIRYRFRRGRAPHDI
jgi:hypothetical protein